MSDSNVTSRPLRRMPDLNMLAIRAGALLIIVPLWLADGKYSLDGILWLLSILANWLGMPVLLGLPGSGWLYLAGIIGTASLFTSIEAGQWGLVKGRRWRVIGLGTVMVWLVFSAADLGTTYLGVVSQPGDLPIQQWVAATPIAAGMWSVVISYLPEFLYLAVFRRHHGASTA